MSVQGWPTRWAICTATSLWYPSPSWRPSCSLRSTCSLTRSDASAYCVISLQRVPKNDPTCFCQNFVKSPSYLKIFGTQIAKTIVLCRAVCVPKTIKFGGDVTKFWQQQVGSFFGTPCTWWTNKTKLLYFVYIFDKYWPIFTIMSPVNFVKNVLFSGMPTTAIMSLHYLVKHKYPKTINI